MEKAVVNITIEVPFCEYKNKALNKKAKVFITQWIRETIKDKLCFIPMYVEEDNNGSFIDDCSRQTKITVKRSNA